MTAATTASVARSRSGASERIMPRTACATTATAATLRPCSQALPAPSPTASRPSANRTRASAEGSVKAAHAASAPVYPARDNPMAMPTWLLAGPGRNWHSATRSA